MFEKFIESKPIKTKETTAKRIAREMLERFHARVRKSNYTERDEKVLKPGPEDVMIAEEIKKEASGVITSPTTPIGIAELPNLELAKETEIKKIEDVAKPPKEEEKENPYESTVTKNYFESWEELKLEGNPDIKEAIKENIIQAEQKNQKAYENAAAELGISAEEFKSRLQAKVEDMVGRAEFFKATPLSVLEKVMNIDGRWKSQFETATSNGCLRPEARAADDVLMFGFNKTEASGRLTRHDWSDRGCPKEVLEKDKDKRPIYGYFSDEEHGAINNIGKIPPPTSVVQYGAINVKIKKETALRKATITFQDSLGRGRKWPPTPAVKPHFTSFPLDNPRGYILELLKKPSVLNWGKTFTEVQYHNQLTVEDIESIYVSENNNLYPDEIKEARRIFNEYKRKHPESTIQLIEF